MQKEDVRKQLREVLHERRKVKLKLGVPRFHAHIELTR